MQRACIFIDCSRVRNQWCVSNNHSKNLARLNASNFNKIRQGHHEAISFKAVCCRVCTSEYHHRTLQTNTCLNLSHDRILGLFVSCTHLLTVVVCVVGTPADQESEEAIIFQRGFGFGTQASEVAVTSVPLDDYDDLEFITGVRRNCPEKRGTRNFLVFASPLSYKTLRDS